MIGLRNHRPGTVARLCAALAAVTLSTATVVAHPGQSLDVRIYVEDDGVEIKMLISADYVDAMLAAEHVDMRRPARTDGGYEFRTPEDRKNAWDRCAALFPGRNPVRINGKPTDCRLRAMEFVAPVAMGPGAFAFPPDLRVTLWSASAEPLKQVAVQWTMYPDDPMRVAFGLPPEREVIAQLTTADSSRVVVFNETEPEFVWHAPREGLRDREAPALAAIEPRRFPVPVVSVALAILAAGLGGVALARRRGSTWKPTAACTVAAAVGAVAAFGVARVEVTMPWGGGVRPPSADEAVAIFEALQRNVYEAFERRDESDVYDTLAQSVSGDFLDEVYNEVYQSLVLRDQGGAVARIKGVEILDSELESTGVLDDDAAPAFTVRSRWRVHGAVYHWGHVHKRTNEYRARYTVAQVGDNWRITSIADMEQERIPMQGDDPIISEGDDPVASEGDDPVAGEGVLSGPDRRR